MIIVWAHADQGPFILVKFSYQAGNGVANSSKETPRGGDLGGGGGVLS